MKTKTVKRRKLNIKKLMILLLMIYIASYGGFYLYQKPVRNIIITGNTLITDAEIIKAAKLKNYPSMFSINKKDLSKKIKKLPLVSTVTIKKDFKFRLHITVEEAKVLFVNNTNNKLMLSVGKYIDNDYTYGGIPSLINYAPEEILKEFTTKFSVIDYGILSLISEIEYSPTIGEDGMTIDETRFALYMNDGNLVYTNTNKCKNMQFYREIYASLKDKKGTLYLDSGNYKNVVFMPYESVNNEL